MIVFKIVFERRTDWSNVQSKWIQKKMKMQIKHTNQYVILFIPWLNFIRAEECPHFPVLFYFNLNLGQIMMHL